MEKVSLDIVEPTDFVEDEPGYAGAAVATREATEVERANANLAVAL